jgi:hypothetical protein
MGAQPNKITGANAGGPPQSAIRTSWTARIAQFCRWTPVMRTKVCGLLELGLLCILLTACAGCAHFQWQEDEYQESGRLERLNREQSETNRYWFQPGTVFYTQ